MEQLTAQTQALIYCRRSNGLDIRVEQTEHIRWLLINGQRQSQMDLTAPSRAIYPYVQQFVQSLSKLTSHDILQFGLGAGELNRCILSKFSEANLTTVEREPAIVDIYQEFFQLPETKARERLLIGTINDVTYQCFDAVIVDIYPWPQQITAILHSLLPLLKTDGMLLLNLPHPELSEEVQAWCQRSFQHVDIFQNPGYQNQLFCCC